MFTRIPLLVIFTIFWSALAWLLFLIIVSATDSVSLPEGYISFGVLIVLIAMVPCLFLYEGRILGNLLALFPAPLEPGRRNRRNGAAVLAYIEQAVRMNVPLSPMLDAAARTEQGRLRYRLNALRELIDAGVELSVALEQAVPEVSSRSIGLIVAGERSGQLPLTLGRLLAPPDPVTVGEDYESRFAVAYILMMLVAMTIVLSLITIFVEPKFKDIFKDFHLPISGVNLWVINTASTVAPYLAIFALAMLLVWFIYGVLIMIRKPRGAPDDFWGLLAYLGSMLPWIGEPQRNRSWADMCRVLADSFAAGWPADAALAQAQDLVLAPRVRRVVQRWNSQVQRGMPLGEAAQNAGLPAMFAGILGAAGDQTPAALDFLARYYANRFSRVRILLRGAVVPAAVTGFGICVATIALSVFLPLLELINHLANYAEGVR